MSQFLSLFLIIFALLAAAMALLAVRLFFAPKAYTACERRTPWHAVTNGRLCPNAPATLPKNHNQ